MSTIPGLIMALMTHSRYNSLHAASNTKTEQELLTGLTFADDPYSAAPGVVVAGYSELWPSRDVEEPFTAVGALKVGQSRHPSHTRW